MADAVNDNAETASNAGEKRRRSEEEDIDAIISGDKFIEQIDTDIERMTKKKDAIIKRLKEFDTLTRKKAKLEKGIATAKKIRNMIETMSEVASEESAPSESENEDEEE